MLTALIFTVCSIATGYCETHTVLTDATPIQCAAGAQSELARLSRDGQRVVNYECREVEE